MEKSFVVHNFLANKIILHIITLINYKTEASVLITGASIYTTKASGYKIHTIKQDITI